MAKCSDIYVNININAKISLWQCIKLRIAGKNFEPIVAKMLKEVKESFSKNNNIDRE